MGSTVKFIVITVKREVKRELCEKDPNGIMIQDTAWEGYEKIPGWIIKGYGLIVDEFLHQIKEKPTHIFIQAGVGSLAAGIILGLEERMKPEELPVITIVEPETVALTIYQLKRVMVSVTI